jgi:hypothetical protein
MAARTDYYKVLGVDKKATPRRSRRRTASSRASTTRTRTRGTGGRGALQADLRGPTTSCRTPRSASSTTAAASPSGGSPFGGGGPGAGGFGRARSPTSSPTCSAARPRCAPHGRRADQAGAERARRRDGGLALLRPGRRGRAAARVGATHARARPAAARARARHAAPGLPAVPGPGRRVPGPGPVLDHPAVPPLRRLGHRDRGPVPTCAARGRLRSSRSTGSTSRRASRTARGSACRQGRGGLRGGPPATSIVITPVRSRRLPAQGRPPRGRGADHVAEAIRGADVEVPTLRRDEEAARAAPGRSTGRSSACAARARPARQGARPRAGDIHYRFVIDVPRTSPRSSGRRWRSSRR